MLESGIQSAVKRRLEKAGWLVVKCMKMSLNGWPDLMAFRDGVVLFIEVKQPGKKPNPVQVYRHGQLGKKGFIVLTITNPNELTEHGL